MSTSAKIYVRDGRTDGLPPTTTHTLDRSHDGYPSLTGADILRALYQEKKYEDGYTSAFFGEAAPYIVASRLVTAGPQTLCPSDRWYLFEYIYEVQIRDEGARIILYERSPGDEPWNSLDDLPPGTAYTPDQFAARINEERERENGRVLLLNMQGSDYRLRPYIDEYGRETEERATPIVGEDVATWLDPDTGELVGRSLIAKRPRVTVNGENEPNSTEMAARNGVRALVDFGGRQAVTEGGDVYDLTEDQLAEIAEEYERVRRIAA